MAASVPGWMIKIPGILFSVVRSGTCRLDGARNNSWGDFADRLIRLCREASEKKKAKAFCEL